MTNKVLAATISQQTSAAGKGYLRVAFISFMLVVLATGFWFLRTYDSAAHRIPKNEASVIPVPVVTTMTSQRDVPVKFKTKGTVSPIQIVEVRPQVAAAIKTVHIKEGQFVAKGERLFTLDTRAEEANLAKSIAQLAKTKVELQDSMRQLHRQRELFHKNFISQATLDVAENQVELLRNQLKFDEAAVQADRVTRGYGEIVAPIAGRTGAIQVYPGSLVRPEASLLVSITQIDPIYVRFELPERELAALKQALTKGKVTVSAQLNLSDKQEREGHIVFIDSAVDTASGTIQVKAEFANADGKFWPGMFANVTLIASLLPKVLTVPAQALQTGPNGQFLFTVGEDNKAILQRVNVKLIQEGIAVVEGIEPGKCVVIEGAQHLRAGTTVNPSRTCGQILHSDQGRLRPDSGNNGNPPLPTSL
ncbi:efflux RND transporter periplasmic adaptor subunit [Nitrosomonas communis]|uniref:RND family efflux transporter, MFP subunit n=1 Tax=Nitrosomonas communis TaxID=44574 RepID=A0A1I4KML0_9PROT|nr:efflux RND transporter periplasmic adaptor subunit [Nitrosomonas communis]SFL79833.1 RND family efflux transporter, MFP subunit [Nitrosomonas communis]